MNKRPTKFAVVFTFSLWIVAGFFFFLSPRETALDFGPGQISLSSEGLYPDAEWAADPRVFGNDLPPIGQSAFDALYSQRVDRKTLKLRIPFPYSQLVSDIDSRLANKGEDGYMSQTGVSGIVGIMIPKGRSLQRDAVQKVGPDFIQSYLDKGINPYFRFPRIAITANSPSRFVGGDIPVNLQDRLYIGFQENAEVLEIISYNELAGRFEFQVVEDYNEKHAKGGYVEVENAAHTYQMRGLCLACHQNHSPIFPRGRLWSEFGGGQSQGENDWLVDKFVTNNLVEYMIKGPGFDKNIPAKEKGVTKSGEEYFYHGLPVSHSTLTLPQEYDAATDRAVFFTLYNRLWGDCLMSDDDGNALAGDNGTQKCRANLLKMMLYKGLTGVEDPTELPQVNDDISGMVLGWNNKWPNGLKLPNPNIPNRDLRQEEFDKVEGEVFRDDRVRHPDELKRMAEASKIHPDFEPIKDRDPIGNVMFDGDEKDEYELMADIINGFGYDDEDAPDRKIKVNSAGMARILTDMDYIFINRKIAQPTGVPFSCSQVSDRTVDDQELGQLTEYRLGGCKEEEGGGRKATITLKFQANNFVKGEATSLSVSGQNLSKVRFESYGSLSSQGSINGATMSLDLKPLHSRKYIQARGARAPYLQFTGINIKSHNLSDASAYTLTVNVSDDFGRLITQPGQREPGAVDKLVGDKGNSIRALAHPIVSRRIILNDLFKHLGVKHKFDAKALVNGGKPLYRGGKTSIFVSKEDVGYPVFHNTCVKCHSKLIGSDRDFLNGTKAQNINRFLFCTEKGFHRVTAKLYRDTEFKTMPFKLPDPFDKLGREEKVEKYVADPRFINLRDYMSKFMQARGLKEKEIFGRGFSLIPARDEDGKEINIYETINGEDPPEPTLSACMPRVCARNKDCKPKDFDCCLRPGKGRLNCQWAPKGECPGGTVADATFGDSGWYDSDLLDSIHKGQ